MANTLGFGLAFHLKDEFTKTSDKIQGSFKKFGVESDKMAKKVNNSLNSMKLGFTSLASGLVLLSPLAKATQISSEFNKEISAVGAVSNATAKELLALKKQAIDLGGTTAFKAKQVAQAQKFLGQAGFKTNQTLQAMLGTLNLASAGNVELAKTADIASNVISGLGLEAKEMNRVADVFAKTTTTSNTTVLSLGESFKEIAPLARNFKIPLEEVSSAIGVLGDSGFQGTRATNTLSTSLLRFTKPTRQMSQMIEKLGINIFDTNGQFIGLNNLVAEIEKSTQGFTDAQKGQAVATLFGANASGQFLTLLNAQKTVIKDGKQVTLQGSEALKAYTKSLESAGGTAQKIANKQLDNLAGDMTKLNSALEGFAINIGDKIEPLLRPFAKGLALVVSGFSALSNTRVGQAIIFLTGLVGALAVSFGALVVAINLSKFASLQAAKAFSSLGKTQIATAFAQKGLIGGFRALAIAARTAIIPLLPYIAVATAIAGAVIFVRKSFFEFQKVLKGTAKPAKGLLGFMQKLGGIVFGVIQVFKTWDGKSFDLGGKETELKALGILDTVKKIGTWLVRLKEFAKGFGDGFMKVFNFIGDGFKFISEKVGKFFDKIGLGGDLLSKNQSKIEGWIKTGKVLGVLVGTTLVFAFGALALSVATALAPILAAVAALAAVALVVKEVRDTILTGGTVVKVANSLKNISEGAGIEKGDSSAVQREKLQSLASQAGIENFSPTNANQLKALSAFVDSRKDPSEIGDQIASNSKGGNTTTTETITKESILEKLVVELNLDGEKLTEAVNRNQAMQVARAN